MEPVKVEEKPVTVELPTERPAPTAGKKITLKELEASGLSPAEIEMAKKQGRVAEPKAEEPVKETVTETEKVAEEPVKTEEPEKKETEPSAEDRRVLKADTEDKAVLAEIAKAGELSPEQESAVLGLLTRNGQALYWNYKRERSKRREIELSSQHDKIKLKDAEQRIEDLRKQLETGRPAPAKTEDELLALEGDQPTDDLDKPLTLRQLQELKKQEQDEAEKTRREREQQAGQLAAKLETMEADGKARFNDFDAVTDLANDLIKNVDSLVADPRANALIKRKVAEFGKAVVNGDELAPDLAYELGKLHPKHGQKVSANGNGERDNGTSKADRVAKAVENASRRTSSATLTGGGTRRLVSVNDITLEQAAKLPASEFAKLPREVRERLLRQ